MLSRIVGLVRDRIVFGAFGATIGLDAFIVAMRVPNLFRELLGEGSLGSAFSKVFSEVAVKDKERAASLLKESLLLMTLLSIVMVALGILAAPWLVQLMTFMASPDQAAVFDAEAVGLARLLFPVFGFMFVGAVAMGALHQQGRFFLTAIAPILFSLGYILGAVVIADWFLDIRPAWVEEYIGDPGLTGLSIGVLIGAFLQVAVQITGLWRPLLSKATGKTLLRLSPELKKVFFLMGPMVIAASSAQVNQIVVTNFSTSLEPGTVTRLQAAFRLLHLPVALFAVALGVTVLPALTRAITKAGGIDAHASAMLQDAVEMVLWCMAPCLVFYAVNGTDVVAFLFQSGRFTAYDSGLAGAALGAYAFSLIAYGLMKVLQAFYFSTDRTSYPMKVSLIGVAINFVFLYLFVDMGITGLAAAFSCSLSVNTILLIVGLRGQSILFAVPRFLKSMTILVGSSCAAGAIQAYVLSQWHGYFETSGPVWLRSGGVLVVNALVLLGVVGGAACLYLRLSPLQLLGKMRR